jgi:hypothetical protein
MAQTHKQLAQSQPAANTDTTVYTVPALTKTLVYSMVVANIANGSSTFRIHIVPSGGSVGVDNAIYRNVNVPGKDTFVANISILIEAGGFIVVRSSDGNCTFTISGLEIT